MNEWKILDNKTLQKRLLFGQNGRLIEIMNAEDQELAINITKAAETHFVNCEYSYWWSGLVHLKSKDQTWKWIESEHKFTQMRNSTCNFRWKRSNLH